jgi:mono/diheme cytochrome c family protein
MNDRWKVAATSLLAITALCAGCGAPVAEFRRYETYRRLQEKSLGIDEKTKTYYTFDAQQRKDVDDILWAMFGTPDQPTLPQLADADISQVVDLNLLKLAAGPVGSDETGRPTGLYREHCAHCHGITGDGNGPTAIFLNPYPRDYRPGRFKFKSTPIGQRPTHDDLKKIVTEGIPGTAMPSFRLLPEQEVESLVHYVKYLSLRGQMERRLYETLTLLEVNERIIDPAPADTAEAKTLFKERLGVIQGLASEIVGEWISAEELDTHIDPRPKLALATFSIAPEEEETKGMPKLKAELFKKHAVASVEELRTRLVAQLGIQSQPAEDQDKAISKHLATASREFGQRLYYGGTANCFSCHGPSALGDGQTTDYDSWVIEFSGKLPKREQFPEWEALGMLPPRNIRPRNLRQGIYRGGMRPIDLFWRIKNGIEGTPMPGNDKLKPEEIWHLVNYVQSLPYESISDPRLAVPDNRRERM